MIISVTNELKCISPPSEIIFLRIFFTTVRNISVPICGLCKYFISAGAPASTKASNTSLILLSFIRVVNFPSEKVPAPPSPNCTLEFFLSAPPCQKSSISRWRVSTSAPRSKIIGA